MLDKEVVESTNLDDHRLSPDHVKTSAGQSTTPEFLAEDIVDPEQLYDLDDIEDRRTGTAR